MKRILIYSHDTFGLGNIRRVLAVAKHLVDSDAQASVLIVSGSPMLHAFRLQPRIDYVKLPCLARSLDGSYGVKSLSLPYADAIRMRANLLSSAALDFDPALILVDKKPFGVANELAPALDLLQRRGRRPKVVLLLRDILDQPELTAALWRKNGYFEAIDEHYDQVLVVGTPEIFDLAHEYQFPANTRRKVRYCGYIGRERSRQDRASVRASLGVGAEQRLVLVTVGGGEDGYQVLSTYLQGLRDVPQAAGEGVVSLLLCGPEMAEAQRQRVVNAAAQLTNVRVQEFSADLMALMEAADLVLAMSGYNTVCEVLSLKKRAIFVPRVRPVQEQWIRAERLAQLGLARAIHPDQLNSIGLMHAVREELDVANVHQRAWYRIDMNGLNKLAEHLNTLTQHQIAQPIRAAASLSLSS